MSLSRIIVGWVGAMAAASLLSMYYDITGARDIFSDGKMWLNALSATFLGFAIGQSLVRD